MPKKSAKSSLTSLADEIASEFERGQENNQEPEERLPPKNCLKCDEEFVPEITGQRICSTCRKSNSRISDMAQGVGWQVQKR